MKLEFSVEYTGDGPGAGKVSILRSKISDEDVRTVTREELHKACQRIASSVRWHFSDQLGIPLAGPKVK